jgi:hypothetical protein
VAYKPRAHHRKPKAVITKPKPWRPPTTPVLASGALATQKSGFSPALLIILFGVLAALVGVGFSLVPASALPFSMRIRLERSRQSIMLVGFAVGVACAFVGLLGL